MKIDQEKQQKALQETQRILKENEQRRAAVRLERSFREYIGGRDDALFVDEVVHNFPVYMFALHEEGDEETVVQALTRLGDTLVEGDRLLRERAIMVVSVFIQLVVEREDESYLETLSAIVVAWLKSEKEFIGGFEFVCNQLQQMIVRLLTVGKWYEVENLIVVLYQISEGIMEATNVMRRVIRKVLAGISDEEILHELLEGYLDPYQGERDIAESIVTHLGGNATRFLLNRLIHEETKERRFMIIEMMPFSEELIDAAKAVLDEDPPWYVVRNIILVLSRGGDGNYYDIIAPYADHDDMRVQQQVVNGVWKMGGDNLIERLLEILVKINDELKTALVTQLSRMHDNKAVGHCFVNLVYNRNSFSRLAKDDLLAVLSESLVYFPSEQAAACLKEILVEREQSHGKKDRVYQQAQKSLVTMEKVLASEEDAPISPADTEELKLDEEDLLTDTVETLTLDEKELFGDADAELAFDEDLIASVADDRQEYAPNFLERDGVADGEEDDDAYAEILSSTAGDGLPANGGDGENHHLTVWSDFYESMNTEEFEHVYSSLVYGKYMPGEYLVHDKAISRNLFLIDSGEIEILASSPEGEVLVSNLRGGDLIGMLQFFIGKDWPVALIAQETVELHFLSMEKAETLFAYLPDLEMKLRKYCERHDVISILLDMDIEESVQEDEVKLTNMNRQLACFTSWDGDDQKGECRSRIAGGLRLQVPFSSQAKPEELLNVLVEAVLCDADDKCEKCFGVIGGVHALGDENESSLELLVKFYNPFRSEQYVCRALSFL